MQVIFCLFFYDFEPERAFKKRSETVLKVSNFQHIKEGILIIIARVLYSLMVRHLKVGEVGYPGRLGRTQLSTPKMLPKAFKVKCVVNFKSECLNPVV